MARYIAKKKKDQNCFFGYLNISYIYMCIYSTLSIYKYILVSMANT